MRGPFWINFPKVERKAQTVFSDIQEAVQNKMPFKDIIKDIKDQELCATVEHQKILVTSLIEKVIEGKDNDRLMVAGFLLDLIENIKNMNFLSMWVTANFVTVLQLL